MGSPEVACRPWVDKTGMMGRSAGFKARFFFCAEVTPTHHIYTACDCTAQPESVEGEGTCVLGGLLASQWRLLPCLSLTLCVPMVNGIRLRPPCSVSLVTNLDLKQHQCQPVAEHLRPSLSVSQQVHLPDDISDLFSLCSPIHGRTMDRATARKKKKKNPSTQEVDAGGSAEVQGLPHWVISGPTRDAWHLDSRCILGTILCSFLLLFLTLWCSSLLCVSSVTLP